MSGVNSGLSGATDGCVVVKLGRVARGGFAKASIVMSKLSREYGGAEKSQAGGSSSNGRVKLAKSGVCEEEYWELDWGTITDLLCNCERFGVDAGDIAEYMHSVPRLTQRKHAGRE